MPIGRKKIRRVFFVRHGERVDNVFRGSDESWVTQAFGKTGKYERFNINMPAKLCQRPDDYHGWAWDSPLTEVGMLQARVIGRAITDEKISFDKIYVSPAYRCIQTAWYLTSAAEPKKSMPLMCIEPGLYEWGMFSKFPIKPKFLPPDLLNRVATEMGHRVLIDTSYHPMYTMDVLPQEEPLLDYYQRSYNVVHKFVGDKSKAENILVVGHGATLEVGSRALVGGQKPATAQQFVNLVNTVPYVGLLCVTENPKEKSGWFIDAPPILGFQHNGNGLYDWTIARSILTPRGEPEFK